MTAEPAGPPPDRPDRDAGPRGRPRGRRVLPDRAEALRRAVEGHRGAGLDRAGRLRRGAGDPARRRAAGLRDRRAEERYRLASCTHAKTQVVPSSWSRSTPGEPTLVIGQYLDQLDELADAPRRPGDQGRDPGQGAGAALRGVPHRRDRAAGGLQGRELLHRPARGRGRHPGLRVLRLPPGGGPAPRPAAAPQGGRPRPRTSTRSSPATPSTPTSPRTASASSPSRATRTGSSTPMTCRPNGRRAP